MTEEELEGRKQWKWVWDFRIFNQFATPSSPRSLDPRGFLVWTMDFPCSIAHSARFNFIRSYHMAPYVSGAPVCVCISHLIPLAVSRPRPSAIIRGYSQTLALSDHPVRFLLPASTSLAFRFIKLPWLRSFFCSTKVSFPRWYSPVCWFGWTCFVQISAAILFRDHQSLSP